MINFSHIFKELHQVIDVLRIYQENLKDTRKFPDESGKLNICQVKSASSPQKEILACFTHSIANVSANAGRQSSFRSSAAIPA